MLSAGLPLHINPDHDIAILLVDKENLEFHL